MRIVFASLGSLGDLHPLLALARAAAERGHVPVIAASAGYREYLQRLGFLFHAIRPEFEFEPKLVGHLFDPKKGPERLMREQIFPNVRKTHADLMEATEGADLLVVGELLYVAPLVAKARGIPWANAVLAPTSFLSAHDPCVLAPAQSLYALRHLGRWPYQLIFALGRRVTRRWGEPLAQFRRELGFSSGPSAVFDAKHSPWLTLALFPAFLAKPQPDWPARTVQTGFPFFSQTIRPEAAERMERFLAAGSAPVVFTLGSSVVQIAKDFYHLAAEAAGRAGHRAILLTGANAAPPDLPGEILALDYVPLDRVLPHASAVVHQGGVGTCGEALRWGLPSLVIPFGFDQPDNAERLRRLGAGMVLPRKRISAARLANALEKLFASPAIFVRARELATRMNPAKELEESVDALESLVRSQTKHEEMPAGVA